MSHNTSNISPQIAWALSLSQLNYLSSELPLRGFVQTTKYIKDRGELQHGTAPNLFDTILWKSTEGWIFTVSPCVTDWETNHEHFLRLLGKAVDRTHRILYQYCMILEHHRNNRLEFDLKSCGKPLPGGTVLLSMKLAALCSSLVRLCTTAYML